MTPEQWQRAYDVFAAVLTMPPTDQAAYVEQMCKDAPTVQQKVRELLNKDGEFTERSDGWPFAAELPPPTDVWLGRRIGVFVIQKHLGGGGMGDVYLAERMEPFRQLVAIKILKPTLVDPSYLQRFAQERQALADLSHSLIVRLLDGGRTDTGSPYLVMEYVAGPTLAQRIGNVPFAPDEAAALLRELADAVAHAHDKGILHRDLKPANVLIDSNGRPRITDFGLAKTLQSPQDLTQSRAILGTPSYMAPEQAQGNRTASAETDVYGLGAVLYCMLTGRPPFLAPTVFETIRNVVEIEPVAPEQLQPSIPDVLSDICLKCLEKEPRRRYGSAGELRDALDAFLRGDIQRKPRRSKRKQENAAPAPRVYGPKIFALTFAIGVFLTAVNVIWASILPQNNLDGFPSAIALYPIVGAGFFLVGLSMIGVYTWASRIMFILLGTIGAPAAILAQWVSMYAKPDHHGFLEFAGSAVALGILITAWSLCWLTARMEKSSKNISRGLAFIGISLLAILFLAVVAPFVTAAIIFNVAGNQSVGLWLMIHFAILSVPAGSLFFYRAIRANGPVG